MLLIRSKALLSALAIFFSTTAVVISGLVISNSRETTSFQNLSDFSLEDVSEDSELLFTKINPTELSVSLESSKIASQKSSDGSVSCNVEEESTSTWWKPNNDSSGSLTLNDLRGRMCGLVSYLKLKNVVNVNP